MNDWIPFIEAMLVVGFFCIYVLYNVFADDCEQYRKYLKVRKWPSSTFKDYK
jgi:hypothetical protein